MLTYKNLYCSLVRSMSEAIDLYDEGKGILAREGLKKSPVGRRRPSHFPRHHPRRTHQQLPPSRRLNSAASAAMPPPHAVCRHATVTRASRSKARLLNEPTRRDSWRSHVHRT